jgi:hypothetical protein
MGEIGEVKYTLYKEEKEILLIKKLMDIDLSEPYSV